VPVILGEHVTLDAGTGLVHTAPAHGAEDFVIGQVRPAGRITLWTTDGHFLAEREPLFAGQHVNKANEPIIETLEGQRRAAVPRADHATATRTAGATRRPSSSARRTQWFIGMEHEGRRRGRRPHAARGRRKAIADTTVLPAGAARASRR
jgi:isoleucyl-tRNA synthetase